MADKEDKQWALNVAIDIIKQYANSANAVSLDSSLDDLYKKLLELREETNR